MIVAKVLMSSSLHPSKQQQQTRRKSLKCAPVCGANVDAHQVVLGVAVMYR
jgi:hypothetical protein